MYHTKLNYPTEIQFWLRAMRGVAPDPAVSGNWDPGESGAEAMATSASDHANRHARPQVNNDVARSRNLLMYTTVDHSEGITGLTGSLCSHLLRRPSKIQEIDPSGAQIG